MKVIKLGVILACFVFSFGCARLLFESDIQDHLQIYRMTLVNDNPMGVTNISQTPNPESFPDVSPDGQRYVFISIQGEDEKILIRDIDGTDTTEIWSSNKKKIWPRWSCQQDLIAFAEFTSDSKAQIFVIRADVGGTPHQVTNPAGSQSDSGGHDFFENGNKIIFSRSDSTAGTWDLYYKSSDGTGSAHPITPTNTLNEVLPVVSYDGSRLAYLTYFPLAPGWPESITVAKVGTWTPIKQITMQPPIGARKIGAIGFTHNDKGLYVATKSADVSATPDTKKYEIFLVKGIEPNENVVIKRVTSNDALDHHPSAIPSVFYTGCTRCLDVRKSEAIPRTQQFTLNSVVIKAATLPSGNPSSVSVEDYSSPRDGINEIAIPWSETDTGQAEFATINFPSELFGDGPTEVEVTAFHYHSLRLQAYDSNGNLISTADHTLGQNVSQALTLDGGNISKIAIIGAEIGISDICYRR